MGDRNSIGSRPLTVNDLVKVIVAASALVTATSTTVHLIWPPHLSDADTKTISDNTHALADAKASADEAAKAAMSAREDFRCGLVEMRAHFDASDDLGPKATTYERKQHRYSVAAKALSASPGCTVPRFEPLAP